MSKVYDNGTMRTATAEEEQNINMNLGGGTGRFELLDSLTISEEIRQKVFTLPDNYDELFIVVEGIKGTLNGQLQVNPKNTLNETKYYNIADVLSPTDGKSFYIYLLRNTERNYRIRFCRNNFNQSPFELCFNFSSMNYKDKLKQVTVGTNTGNVIIGGTIKIYGRNIKE